MATTSEVLTTRSVLWCHTRSVTVSVVAAGYWISSSNTEYLTVYIVIEFQQRVRVKMTTTDSASVVALPLPVTARSHVRKMSEQNTLKTHPRCMVSKTACTETELNFEFLPCESIGIANRAAPVITCSNIDCFAPWKSWTLNFFLDLRCSNFTKPLISKLPLNANYGHLVWWPVCAETFSFREIVLLTPSCGGLRPSSPIPGASTIHPIGFRPRLCT